MKQFARLLMLTLIVGCLSALTGCSSNSPNSNVAEIRAVDACSNGGTATIIINEGTAAGQQTFFQASPYLFLQGGAAGFQFTLTGPPAGTFAAPNEVIAAGGVYSAVMIGRADVTDEIDARFPKLVFLQDNTGRIAGGSAGLRVLNAAPDSPNVDLVVDGAVVASNTSYAHNSGYVSVPPGGRSVQVNQAGTSTVLAGPQNISLAVGKHYTIYFVEPDVSTPTFGLRLLGDNP
ncbi:MAG TPA: DUF4397 domain-containing protein [Capsulimonadaceae bacterium]|nr:DUF4397 domain-containing protein [Capsulimonadaceae bacterium]